MSQTQFNPYASPSAESAIVVPQGERLATRSERFLGALLDTLIVLPFNIGFGIALALGLIMAGMNPDGIEFTIVVMIASLLVHTCIFLLFNGYLLATRGQTIGKLALGTRIVNEDGSRPDFVMLILKRYLWLWALVQIPRVGLLFGLINALMIFRSSVKCLHDDVAGTKVIKIS